MMRPARRLSAVAGGLAFAAVTLPGCAAEPVRPTGLPPATPSAALSALGLPRDPVVLLDVDAAAGTMTQLGSADVVVDAATLNRGRFSFAEGRDGHGAIDFPEYRATEPYPRAVVRVANAGEVDQLSPGAGDFVWGADFRIDEASFGAGIDNGDNLVQRGLSSHPVFFKAEVDEDRPACTVKGDEGELIVRASERVRPGWWYRLRCERRGDELIVRVTEFAPDGGTRTYASRVAGPVGTLDFPRATTLSVGGKLTVDGEPLRSATDQFNGLVMFPVLAFTSA